MTTANTYLDDFMDKMVTVPNDINRLLRLIRKMDKRVQDLQATLLPQQARAILQIRQLKQKKITEMPAGLKAELQIINKKNKQLWGYSRQKKEIAQQLAHQVSDYTNQLLSQLKNKYKDRPQEEIIRRKKIKIDASRINQNNKKQDFQYDLSKQPQYCYCGRTSFGEMVGCENPFCEIEWFHVVCLQQKNLPQKWYCSECQKQREKTKNPNSKIYFVNKESGV